MEKKHSNKSADRSPSFPIIQYFTAKDVMSCLGIGRSKAYEIIKDLNAELERDGYITIPGKIPTRKLLERLYLSDSVQLSTTTPKGRTAKSKK